ncbi:MAG: nuclear transport factor 2 family protein [Flavobacteriaceae bacterium]|nr:nuclear transport factor 2 family protein [Flavobacteriaceae bacterium]
MRTTLYLLLFLPLLLNAQGGTEIYVFDLNKKGDQYQLINAQNLSENNGYDNQPSFLDEQTLVYASTRNEQTDIAYHNIISGEKKWISNTENGSEYSPLKIPNQDALSAIRLDKDGKQLLYSYDIKTGASTPIIEDLVIGYHVWANNNTMVSFVLGDQSSLVVTNTKKNKHKTIEKNIGRALFKIPGTDLVSYISKKNSQWEIRSLNPKSGKTKKITHTLEASEDMIWTPDGTILMGKGNKLYQFNPKTDTEWTKIASLEKEYLNNISRLAVNPSGTKLAVVVNESPETIVQKQLDAYNEGDIKAFMATFSDGITLYNFPETVSLSSKALMEANFGGFFDQYPDLHVEIDSRIVIGNKVIDEERGTYADKTFHAVAIYEVNHGKITKVTFIRK